MLHIAVCDDDYTVGTDSVAGTMPLAGSVLMGLLAGAG